MEKDDDGVDKTHEIFRVANGIESNMENLQTLAKRPDFLPEHRGWKLPSTRRRSY
jgi:hypothetical protein